MDGKYQPTAVGGPEEDGGVLVIGIGNELRGDDGLGPTVVRALREKDLHGVRVMEMEGEGAALIDAWRGYDRVILVDAIASGSTPGLFHALDACITEIPRTLFRSSSHLFGVGEAIELARRVDLLPHTLWVYGIEGDSFGFGDQLSPSVKSRLPEFLEDVMEKVQELLSERQHEIP
jgi:hydrogenase maturation protease